MDNICQSLGLGWPPHTFGVSEKSACLSSCLSRMLNLDEAGQVVDCRKRVEGAKKQAHSEVFPS